MENRIDGKIARNEGLIRGLQAENAGLEIQKKAASGKSGMEKWRGNYFESSSGLTEEFSDFARDFKRELKKTIGPGYIIVGWSRGHFEVSAFIKNEETGKFAYISTFDVRGGRNAWYDNILVRSAAHEKDYTGGSNDYAIWPGLMKKIVRLTA